MLCNEVSTKLTAFIDNELTSKERENINAHIEKCDLCKKELEELQETLKLSRVAVVLKAKSELLSSLKIKLNDIRNIRRKKITPLAWAFGTAFAMLVLIIATRHIVFKPNYIGNITSIISPNGFITIQDKKGLRDTSLNSKILKGTTIISDSNQHISVTLLNNNKISIGPVGIIKFDSPTYVKLQHGGVYIEAQKNIGIQVKTPMARIATLGTEFYVYSNPNGVMVTIVYGRIRVTNKLGDVEASANEQVAVLPDKPPVVITGEKAKIAVVEAKLRKPISNDEQDKLKTLKGKNIKYLLDFISSLLKIKPKIETKVNTNKIINNIPTGFTFREVLENSLWKHNISYEVISEGIKVYPIPKDTEITKPPTVIDSFPFEYRDLIRAYFRKLNEKKY